MRKNKSSCFLFRGAVYLIKIKCKVSAEKLFTIMQSPATEGRKEILI